LNESPESLFFEATTAIYRGDFLGFGSDMFIGGEMNDIPKQIFFNTEKRFYVGMDHLLPLLTLQKSSIFYGGKNE